jgi:hypothetical protein
VRFELLTSPLSPFAGNFWRGIVGSKGSSKKAHCLFTTVKAREDDERDKSMPFALFAW